MARKTSNTGGRRASSTTRAKARTSAKKAVKKASSASAVKATAKAVAKPKAQKQALNRTLTKHPMPSRAVKMGVTSSSLSASEKKRLAQGEVARATNYVANTVSGVAKSPAKATAQVTNTTKKSNARATRKTVNSAVRRKKPY